MRVRAWRAQPDAWSGRRRRRWLLVVGDATLALALAALAVASQAPGMPMRPPGSDRAVGIALAMLQTLPLAFRRWRPVWVLAVVVAATLGTAIAETLGVAIAGDAHVAGPVCVLVALYSVAVRCRRREAAWAGIASVAVLAWPLWHDSGHNVPAVVVSLGFLAAVWLSGAYVSELRGRAARSRREQELQTGRAVAEEQARVGRELQDVIAHTLSVIVIQAGAALDVFDTSPDQARQALGSISLAGRQALAELRRVLAAVRPQPGEEDGWAAPPGLAGLDGLLDRVRGAGLEVTARVDGAPVGLPAGVDLAAYRIVQEALTNTLKHARAQAAEVHLCYGPAGLVVEVTDDGRAAAPAGRPGPARGRGLIGIGERAALPGGTCQAGPRPGGGFAVRVAFPVDAVGRAGTLASGIAPVSPGQTAAVKETDMSWTAQPDPRSRLRWRRWLLIVGDAALALALAAVALYSVAAHCPRRQAAWAGIAAGAVLAWPLLRYGGMLNLGFLALGWVCGAYVSELRGRAARSRREQDLETGRAVAEEQARVGRELHDVIAHTLSVIVIQAGAAQDVFDTTPDQARRALGSIVAAGRQALAELR